MQHVDLTNGLNADQAIVVMLIQTAHDTLNLSRIDELAKQINMGFIKDANFEFFVEQYYQMIEGGHENFLVWIKNESHRQLDELRMALQH